MTEKTVVKVFWRNSATHNPAPVNACQGARKLSSTFHVVGFQSGPECYRFSTEQEAKLFHDAALNLKPEPIVIDGKHAAEKGDLLYWVPSVALFDDGGGPPLGSGLGELGIFSDEWACWCGSEPEETPSDPSDLNPMRGGYGGEE